MAKPKKGESLLDHGAEPVEEAESLADLGAEPVDGEAAAKSPEELQAEVDAAVAKSREVPEYGPELTKWNNSGMAAITGFNQGTTRGLFRRAAGVAGAIDETPVLDTFSKAPGSFKDKALAAYEAIKSNYPDAVEATHEAESRLNKDFPVAAIGSDIAGQIVSTAAIPGSPIATAGLMTADNAARAYNDADGGQQGLIDAGIATAVSGLTAGGGALIGKAARALKPTVREVSAKIGSRDAAPIVDAADDMLLEVKAMARQKVQEAREALAMAPREEKKAYRIALGRARVEAQNEIDDAALQAARQKGGSTGWVSLGEKEAAPTFVNNIADTMSGGGGVAGSYGLGSVGGMVDNVLGTGGLFRAAGHIAGGSGVGPGYHATKQAITSLPSYLERHAGKARGAFVAASAATRYAVNNSRKLVQEREATQGKDAAAAEEHIQSGQNPAYREQLMKEQRGK